MIELKIRVASESAVGSTLHSHGGEFPDGRIPRGTYQLEEVDGHGHEVVLERDLEPGDSITTVTTSDGAGPHSHEITIKAIESADDGPEERSMSGSVETLTRGGRVLETKVVRRETPNGVVELGIFDGYIATWDMDTGGIFGVPDRFVRGAFLASLEEHRRRGDRQIRLKDLHGRVIGGFPIASAFEDEVGLRATGEINLGTQLGREAWALMVQGVLTDLSIGFTAVEDKIEGDFRIITQAIVWEGSIVDEPANRNAMILELKSATKFADLPIAPEDHAWVPDEAKARVDELGDSVGAYLVRDPKTGAPSTLIADVVDGELRAVPAALEAAALELKESGSPNGQVVKHVERYYAKMRKSSPFEQHRFWGATEVRDAGPRELETMLRDSGSFSKGAARLLASRVSEQKASGYDAREASRRILEGIQEVRRALG